MLKNRVLSLLLAAFPLFCAGAEVNFSGLDLSSRNQLLFKSSTEIPGQGMYDTLFLAQLGERDLSGEREGNAERFAHLTFFPEKLLYLEGSDKLQIQNRFGVFRTDENLQNPRLIDGYPAFVRGAEVHSGKLFVASTSPDGRYLAFFERTSAAYGNLMLLDVVSGLSISVSNRLELSLDGPSLSWSPDSRFFVYEKDRRLYYFAVEQLEGGRVLEESYRFLGRGSMRSIKWSTNGSLYYIDGLIVYRVRTGEFFTYAFYEGITGPGTIAGKIPFAYDPNFDSFWLSPDGNRILLNKGERNFFLYHLSVDDFGSSAAPLNLPYLLIPRNTVVKDVVWPVDDIIVVHVGRRERGQEVSHLYRLVLPETGIAAGFLTMPETGVRSVALSRDRSTLALVTDESVLLKNFRSWEDVGRLPFRKPLSICWMPDGRLAIGGTHTVEVVDPKTRAGRLVCLSQPEQYGFTGSDQAIRVRAGDRIRDYDPVLDVWTDRRTYDAGRAATATERYRVYLENLVSGSYRNIVMVRDLALMGTWPLFRPHERSYEPFPAVDEPIDFLNFTHGSRIRRREVALVFDAVDSVEGLTEVLSTLSGYGVRATFFLNGEFIRRHPGAVKEIAESGHEVGSLFHVWMNLTDNRFKVDEEFIRKGLARNEDEYYAVTGRELSLRWHAPHYSVSSGIIRAGAGLNYTYVGRDVDPLDWVSSTASGAMKELYRPASELAERVIDLKKPGTIVPIRIGKSERGREDYLFQKLDILINNLIVAGYGIVPVSVLMEHGR